MQAARSGSHFLPVRTSCHDLNSLCRHLEAVFAVLDQAQVERALSTLYPFVVSQNALHQSRCDQDEAHLWQTAVGPSLCDVKTDPGTSGSCSLKFG